MAPERATQGGATEAATGTGGTGTGTGLESRLGAMALRYLRPNPAVLDQFEQHASRMRDASRARKRSVAFRNVVDDRDDHEVASVVDTLGKPMPSDVYEGDTHLRTLRTLLSMIDERGWERCANLYCLTDDCYSPVGALSTGLRTRSSSTTPSSAASRASSTARTGARGARPSCGTTAGPSAAPR